ncbi:hypothetical protein [Nocardia sp. NPDC049707]|uniref:hypothetical protein n=1 Tax=Nocardia sp. NPDC049707 TaxID=3154735 RepID=UPI003437C223
MRNINVERYSHPSITSDWSGLVEGVRKDGSRWILWLDADESPALFWAERDEDGAVIGDPIVLDRHSASTEHY